MHACVCVFVVSTCKHDIIHDKTGVQSKLTFGCGCDTLNARTLLVLVVKGHFGSTSVKLQKSVKTDSSRKEACTDHIFAL